MKNFKRSLIRLCLLTFFLLFVAWLGLKMMQYNGDFERMLRDVQRTFEGWGIQIGPVIDKIRQFFKPVIDFFEDKVNQIKQFMG